MVYSKGSVWDNTFFAVKQNTSGPTWNYSFFVFLPTTPGRGLITVKTSLATDVFTYVGSTTTPSGCYITPAQGSF